MFSFSKFIFNVLLISQVFFLSELSANDLTDSCKSIYKKILNKKNIYIPYPVPFKKEINHPNLYLWDNWGFADEGLLHVYSMAADKKLPKSERHFHAHWRHFVSDDGGLEWVDKGAVLLPTRNDKDAFDSSSIWSGSFAKLGDGTYLAAYTGLDPKGKYLQHISFATSRDGQSFERAYNGKVPGLSHLRDSDKFISRGYYVQDSVFLGKEMMESDGTIQALRDPFLFTENNQIHMLFASKALNKKGEVVPAIGHAIIHDLRTPDAIQLLNPITVPDSIDFKQLELPNVFRRADGKYIWIVSTTNRISESQSDLETSPMIRAYISDSLNSELTPYRGNSKLLDTNQTGYYGATLFNDFNFHVDVNKKFFRVFNMGGDKDLTLPSIIYINFDQ